MKKLLIIILLLPLACFSQKAKTKLYPHFIFSGGVAGGERVSAPVVQLSAGVNAGSWFTGIGVGYDAYRVNTIPVYADLRFSFGPKDALYVYANPGIHFLQPNVAQLESLEWGAQKKDLNAGFYGEAGVGFKLKAGRCHHLGLSVGYRNRQMSHTREGFSIWSWMSSRLPDPQVTKDRYSFTTIVTRLTWNIGK